jgi:hypothetical protein
MSSLKTLNNSLSMNSVKKSGIASSKSVLEKLKSLSSKPSINTDKNPLEGFVSSDLSEDLLSEPQSDNLSTFFKVLRYFIAFIVLAFILLNILAALGILPDFLAKLFRPILVFFGYNIGETTRQISDVSDEGTKQLSTALSKTADAGVDLLEEKSKLTKDSTIKALDDATNKYNKPDQNNGSESQQEQEPEPVETDDRAARSGSNKSGYCYIGEDRGFRSCIKVGVNDECISGDIFPTEEICINPNLRP